MKAKLNKFKLVVTCLVISFICFGLAMQKHDEQSWQPVKATPETVGISLYGPKNLSNQCLQCQKVFNSTHVDSLDDYRCVCEDLEYEAYLGYEYEVNGVTHTINKTARKEKQFAKAHKAYKDFDDSNLEPIQVYYNPQKPAKAVFELPSDGFVAVLYAVGSAALIPILIMLVGVLRRRARAQAAREYGDHFEDQKQRDLHEE